MCILYSHYGNSLNILVPILNKLFIDMPKLNTLTKSKHKRINKNQTDFIKTITPHKNISPEIKKLDFDKTSNKKILDIPFQEINTDQILSLIDQAITTRSNLHIITADAASIVMTINNPSYKNVFLSEAFVIPDSAGVIWALNKKYNQHHEKISGIDLTHKLFEKGEKTAYRFFLLGAKPEIIHLAKKKILEKYPLCQIVGTHHGYFNSDESANVLQQIKEANPDILLVALGMPKQEFFIHKHKKDLNIPVSIGIGGSFDVLSGNIKRAPIWVQKYKLEWLWRFIQNPRKWYKVKLLPKFIILTLKEIYLTRRKLIKNENLHKNW